MQLTAANLHAVKNLRHGFFGREGGVSQGVYASLNCGYSGDDDPNCVLSNRSIAMDRLGLPADCLTTVKQVHGVVTHQVKAPAPGRSTIEADALVTDRPGIALGVLCADCAPVLIADPQAGVIGAAHAGWRGALHGVVDSLVQAMIDLGATACDMIGAVGPCIAKASYEVGPDMRAAFEQTDPEGLRLFESIAGSDRYRFDLKAYVLTRFARLGVADTQALPEDTHGDQHRFFSARRSRNRGEPGFGLLLSAIALKDETSVGHVRTRP
ncbi:MAG: polyphenol oxidase family protein [Alphaproteobacteria bacterium]|nr:polyphenol oxidase family protein [Alphaproteobacteria bacterium]